jgi:serine/threonine protein kinase/WD40 repeat protein
MVLRGGTQKWIAASLVPELFPGASDAARETVTFAASAAADAPTDHYAGPAAPPRSDVATVAGTGAGAESLSFGLHTAAGEPPRTGRLDTSHPVAVPGYAILEELGRGGMGVVYKAFQVGLNRTVALKMILAGGHASAQDLARFRSEAEAVARLQHPQIVAIYEIGEHKGLPFFSLEYVEGGSLAQQLTGVPQQPRKSAEVMETLARAMHAAHERGIVHRDLKPANVLMTRDGTPKITDFGLAKQMDSEKGQTRTGAVMGTPSYMAPEQAAGRIKEISQRTDVYALGAILYEMLTGRPPFRGESPMDTMLQVVSDEPVSPSRLVPKLSTDLETICLKCLQKEPGKRYATAALVAEDLGRFLRDEPIRARPVGNLERSFRWCRRNPLIATMTAFVALALVGGTIISSYFAVQSSKREESERSARVTAQQKEQQAIAAEGTARAAQEDLKKKTKELEWIVYKNQVALAHREWQKNNVAAAEHLLDQCDPALRRWEWHYCKRLCHLETRQLSPAAMWTALSPAGDRLAGLMWKGSLEVWNAQTGNVIWTDDNIPSVETGGTVWHQKVAFSPDGKTVLVARADGIIQFRDAAAGKQTDILRCQGPFVLTLAYSPDGRFIAAFSQKTSMDPWAGRGGEVEVWDARTRKLAYTIRNVPGAIAKMAFSPDGQLLAGARWHGATVHVVDAATGKEKWSRGRGRSEGVFTVAFSPDSKQIVSGGAEGDVVISDAATGNEIRTIFGHDGPVLHAVFSHDGRRIATASADNSIGIFDAVTGRTLFTLRGHTWPVQNLSFSRDDRQLFSSGVDGMRFEAVNTFRSTPVMPLGPRSFEPTGAFLPGEPTAR